jgi:hypothetical protein
MLEEAGAQRLVPSKPVSQSHGRLKRVLSKLVLSKLVLSKLVTKMQQYNCYHLIRKEAMAKGQRP